MEWLRKFIKEDLIALTCMMLGIVAANLLVQKYIGRPDKDAISFGTTIISATIGILIGDYVQNRVNRYCKRTDKN